MATASQRASWLPARTRLPPAVAGARNERDPQPQGAQVADCCEKPAEPEPPGIRMSPPTISTASGSPRGPRARVNDLTGQYYDGLIKSQLRGVNFMHRPFGRGVGTPDQQTTRRNPVGPHTYEITFAGHASPVLRAEFDDCEVTMGPDTTTLRTNLPDQGALCGIVERIIGLGLQVIDLHLVASSVPSGGTSADSDYPGRAGRPVQT